jgi:GxxExxY protein
MGGLAFEHQRSVAINYNGLIVDCGYRIDVLVERRIIVERKAIERLLPFNAAQLLDLHETVDSLGGLLVNFNGHSPRHGADGVADSTPSKTAKLP